MEKGKNYARKLLVLGVVGLISLAVLLPIMDMPVANTVDIVPLWIEITEPKSGYLYIMGEKTIQTFTGRTVMLGGKTYRGWHDTFHTGITIKAMAGGSGARIQYVEFAMNNLVMFIDMQEPFEWFYESGDNVFGWNTIKVVVHDNENNVVSDELDILLYMLKWGI